MKLESGERPPREFLRAAEQESRLRQWTQEQEQADNGEDREEQDKLEPEALLPNPKDEDLSVEARRLPFAPAA